MDSLVQIPRWRNYVLGVAIVLLAGTFNSHSQEAREEILSELVTLASEEVDSKTPRSTGGSGSEDLTPERTKEKYRNVPEEYRPTPERLNDFSLPPNTGLYVEGDIGRHHRKIPSITWTLGDDGKEISVTNYIVQLESELNMQDESGRWIETSDEIEITERGAIGRKTRHRVEFAGDLNQRSAVQVGLPDGRNLSFTPLGLSYRDTKTGQSVMIARTKSSRGHLVGRNQVVYPDAFESLVKENNLQIDVRYTQRRSGIEQDVIVTESSSLPPPEIFGMSPETSVVEVITEAFDAPDPSITRVQGPSSKSRLPVDPSGDDLSQDDHLSFGSMGMRSGQAFSVGTGAEEVERIAVTKRWTKTPEGRTILYEAIPYSTIPVSRKKEGASISPRTKAIVGRMISTVPVSDQLPVLPVATGVEASHPMLAMSQYQPKGLLVDWGLETYGNTISNNTMVFTSDTTYQITGHFKVDAQTIIEGGCVIKYMPWVHTEPEVYPGITLELNGHVKCLTSAYRPAIFTSVDDNSVGETITNSTGIPLGFYGRAKLTLAKPQMHYQLQHLQMRDSYIGIIVNQATLSLKHSQIIDTHAPIDLTDAALYLGNCLLATSPNIPNIKWFHWMSGPGPDTTRLAVSMRSANTVMEHCTIHGFEHLVVGTNHFITVRNSLVANVTTAAAATSGNGNVWWATEPSGVFQSVGLGLHYLANGSPYRNAATPGVVIDPMLARELKTMTTYPPSVLGSAVSSELTLNLMAARDADTLDLGYHYVPIDHLASGVLATAPLKIGKSVVLALHGAQGIILSGGSSLISDGSPENLSHICYRSMIQETRDVVPVSGQKGMFSFNGLSPYPLISLRFTEFSAMAGPRNSRALIEPKLQNQNAYGPTEFPFNEIKVRDCVFANTYIALKPISTYSMVLSLFNNLFERCEIDLRRDSTPNALFNLSVRNSTLIYGQFAINYSSASLSNTWEVVNNVFNSTPITASVYPDQDVKRSHNGFANYTTNSAYSALGSSNSQIVPSFSFTQGALGRWYQYSWQMKDAGDVSPSAAGLTHYTVDASEVKQPWSKVALGFAYVAGGLSHDPYSEFSGNQYPTGSSRWEYSRTAPLALPSTKVSFFPTDYDTNYFPGLTNFGVYHKPANDDYYCGIANWFQHPGVTHDSIRSLVVPKSGWVAIVNSSPTDSHDCGGDPTRVRIMLNDTALSDWTLVPAYSVGGTYLNIPKLWVNAGDRIHFQLNAMTNNTCDTVGWQPRISYLIADTDGDSIPDYVEDANGNGVTDAGSGETNWQSPGNPNSGTSGTTGVITYTPLK